jgi:hypothetical protein
VPYEEFIVTEDIMDTDARQLTPILRRWKGKTGFIKFFSHHDLFVMNTPPMVDLSKELLEIFKLVFENSTMSSLIQKRRLLCRIQSGTNTKEKLHKNILRDFQFMMNGAPGEIHDHDIWIVWKGEDYHLSALGNVRSTLNRTLVNSRSIFG